MKKSIFTLGLIASSFLFANATETPIVKDSNSIEINETTPQIFHYTVETTDGVFTGTAETKVEAVKQILSITKNNDVISKTLTEVDLNQELYGNKVYVWGTSTSMGYATGVSKTLKEAQEKIDLVSHLDIQKSKIIESFNTVK